MYLNVNLTPPQSGGTEGSYAHTPKTPEILNSLISLTSTSMSAYNSGYQTHQAVAGDLLSPSSSNASPSEENSATKFGAPSHISASQMSPTNTSDPGGGGGTNIFSTKASKMYKVIPSGVSGTPSPPVPELPSPVSTVEATKSALIKEGLKHQIKSKLQAAGLDTNELLTDTKMVKEELTPQDEERRLRRRERNKIAATKCRNKKKEMTVILMSESETVEDQNIRLKTEIQRLTSEKRKLEKLLEDPKHVASCRHSCNKSSHSSQPPLVIITSPDAPEQVPPSSSAGEVGLPSTGTPINGGVEQSSEILHCFSFCPPSVSSCESSYKTDASSPSYTDLSPPTISPSSQPSVSSPTISMSSKHFKPQPCLAESTPITAYAVDSNFSSLPATTNNSIQDHNLTPLPTQTSLSTQSHDSTLTTNTYLSSKSSTVQSQKRHQPYSVNRSSKSAYRNRANHPSQPELPECRFPCLSKEEIPMPNAFFFPSPPSNLNTPANSSQISPNGSSLLKNDYSGKVRSQLSSPGYTQRYAPYAQSNRQYPINDLCPNQSSSLMEPSHSLSVLPTDTYLGTSFDTENQFLPGDGSRTPFYPSCTYANLG